MDSHIAIVGISTELPSGSWSDRNLDHDSFFEFLLNGGQAYERIPSDRFNIESWKGRNLGQICTEQGAFLKGAHLFDNVEFGVAAKDARNMAPGTRKLVENSFLALLDSGIDYRSRNVGCFVSSTNHNILQISDADEYEIEGSFGGIPAMAANKVSYHLDLLGPSVPVDTACSSSATALHLGVSSLIRGDCEAAVVAGAQINHYFFDWHIYSQAGVIAPGGKCKPFDASADGFSRGEGVVAVVIKPLQSALQDGDYIYGTILGTAINAGGNAASPGAPIPEAQALAMKKAFERAGRSPKQVDYVECHATGTYVGDPAEMNWVGREFGRKETLFVGSVKGNIGHTEITASLASLSKVLSMFRYRTIPPNVNLTSLNPAINWEENNMVAPTVATELPCHSGYQPLIAIASSGIGGANAHVVLQGPPPRAVPYHNLQTKRPVLLLVGGLSPRTATVMASHAAEMALTHPKDRNLLSIKLGRQARQTTWRTFTVLDNSEDMSLPQFPAPVLCPRTKPPIVFLFSGQGPQHINMGRELFSAFPAFRSSILESDKIFKARMGFSLVNDIGLFGDTPPKDNLEEWPINIALPAILFFQIALYDLLLYLGVKPDVLIGHSAGETALVYASGGSRALAVELAIARGEAFSTIEEHGGTMAALSCSASKASELISRISSQSSSQYPVEIACHNAPEAVAIAGPSSLIDEVISLAQLENIAGRKIRTRTPVHSSMIELCRDKYIRAVEDVFIRHGCNSKPQIQTYSTYTGAIFDRPFDAEYFWNNARQPVLFNQTLDTLLSQYPKAVFVEISAHPVLAAYMNEIGVPVSHTLAAARRSRVPVEYRAFLQSLGQLSIAGYNSTIFHRLNSCNNANFDLPVKLPEYPFTRKSFPFYLDGPSKRKPFEQHNGPLNHKYLKVNHQTHPWVSDHVILGEAIMPAAGHVEIALEFGAPILMEVNFRKIWSSGREKPSPIRGNLDGSYWTVTSDASKNNNTEIHADGYLSFETPPPPPPKPDFEAIRSRSELVTHDAFYGSITGLEFGPVFRRVLEAYVNVGEVLAKVKGYSSDLSRDDPYRIHPVLLDCCMQPISRFHDSDPDFYYLPSSIKSVILYRTVKDGCMPDTLYCYQTLRRWNPDSVAVDVTIYDEEGTPVCTMEEFEVQKHRLMEKNNIQRRFDMIYQPVALPKQSLLANHTLRDTTPELPQQNKGMNGDSDDNLREGVNAMVEAASQLLDKTLTSIASLSKRVVNIMFITTDGESLYPRVSSTFDNHHSLYINYFIRSSSKSSATTWNTSGKMDSLAFDQSITDQGLTQRSFDLVYLIGPNTFSESSVSILQTVQGLLTDSGRLILIGPESTIPEWVSLAGNNGLQLLESGPQDNGQITFAEFFFKLPKEPSHVDNNIHFIPYKHCREADLIATLRDLDPVESCKIWLTVDEGPGGDQAAGLLRTLRKEFLNWDMKLAVFPPSFSERSREEQLNNLLPSLENETEVRISTQGKVLVPRIIPLPASNQPFDSTQYLLKQPPNDHVLVRTSTSAPNTRYMSFTGTVLASSSNDMDAGTNVIGLTTSSNGELFVVPSSSTRVYDPAIVNISSLIPVLPGLVVAALAPTVSIFAHPTRLSQWRVLVTHSSSDIGRVVCQLYRSRGIDVVEASVDATLYQLYQLGHHSFDLVVTGYEDPKYLQAIQLLLRRKAGRMFSWNTGPTSLASICDKEPWQIGDAIESGLKCSFGLVLQSSGSLANLQIAPPASDGLTKGSLFRPDKNYLLLGGMGSIGPYVALWMYERGARHIVLSSRRPVGNLNSNSTAISSRMVQYLKSLPDLTLRFEPFDPSNVTKVGQQLSTISPPVAGCFILTASPSDGFSLNLTQEDFAKSHSASLDVLRALKHVMDVDALDFLVHFSSVAAVWGNGGQLTYTGAKAALDGELRELKNAFSFVCPVISGTSLVNRLYSVRSAASILAWQISPDRMIRWLEDAMSTYLSGEKMWYYIPDWDWENTTEVLGLPPFSAYLVPPTISQQTSMTEDDNSTRLMEIITHHLDLRPEDLSEDASLASYGLDSLSASRLSFSLNKAFGVKISQIQLLADITTADIQKKISADVEVDQSQTLFKRAREEMLNCLRKHTPVANPRKKQLTNGVSMNGSMTNGILPNGNSPDKKVVLITGTTGALGSNILHQLVMDSSVETIFALNRPPKGGDLGGKQRVSCIKQGLPEGLESHGKVRLVAYDMAAVELGLSRSIYEEILSSVTHVIHNAWMSDFSLPLSAYEDLIKGTQNLVELVLSSRRPTAPSFSLISTIGVCHFQTTSVPCAETIITPEQIMALDQDQSTDYAGYIQSKWIAEQIVHHAKTKLSLKASIIRVGQLTGGLDNKWDTAHWFPAIVKSGLSVNCLPNGDDVVSWLPVQTAAAAVVDLSDTEGIFHVVHPRPVTWKTIMETVASTLNVPLVPYLDWYQNLKAVLEKGEHHNTHGNPAIKLLDFFKLGGQKSSRCATESLGLLASAASTNAKAESMTLANPDILQLSEWDVNGWIDSWRKDAFLPPVNK